MNIKKNIMKTMCAALACSTFLSNLIPVYATEAIITEIPMDESVDGEQNWNTEESNFEEIEVTYQQSASYFVTIPKTIALGTNKQAVYSVKVSGAIDTNQRVYVAPVDGISSTEKIDFYMKDQTPDSKKANVVATVTQNRLYWNSDDVASGYEETNNSISAPDLTTGNWKGTFQVAINLETMAEHVHNYVNGKCDCGAVDPNHTHNYGEDGKCTICGKETDPYEVAPANEFRNWKYVLDDENNIITLQQYTNTSATDVIVYANYVVNGKTYKTQLADYNPAALLNYMFCNKENIKTIKFSDSLDTSNVTSMERMFMMNSVNATSALTSIDFGDGFDTSNVTSMGQMFYRCESLTDLDLSNFDTSNVTNMGSMFKECRSLTNLDLSNFDTGNVTNMCMMFDSCGTVVNLDLSNFDTSNVLRMDYMFRDCTYLTSLDVSSFDTSSVTNMTYMFYGCRSLTNLDLSSFDTNKVTDMTYMFFYTIDLETIYATNGKWSTSKAATTNMFVSCGTSEVTYK